MIKPIHKFNNGNGATLCNTCSIIISAGLTDDLYCSKCAVKANWDIKEFYEQMDKEVHRNNSDLNK